MNYIDVDGSGRILGAGATNLPQADMPLAQGAVTRIVVQEPVMPHTHRVVDGQVVALPQQPSEHHEFDYSAGQWVDPRALQDFKDAKWSEMKHERATREFSGFTWDGSTFDSDQLSQSRISGVALAAALDPTMVVDWTLKDNTVRTLTAAEFVQAATSMLVFVGALHATSRLLREQIEAAQSREAVEAIAWPD